MSQVYSNVTESITCAVQFNDGENPGINIYGVDNNNDNNTILVKMPCL